MREGLKIRLYKSALNRAKINNYTFSPYTKLELNRFINEGVDKMSSTEYSSDLSRQIAEENLMMFIDVMNNENNRNRMDESPDDTSFTNARMRVCPLWPFC
jgi:hypothetical protein